MSTQDTQQRQCIVISLIRHAECESNANERWYEDDAKNPLTSIGRLQAESLGKNWENTRIDYLLSSPLERALCTANTLSDHNKGRPEVVIHPDLVERRFGRKVVRLMNDGRSEEGREALRGKSLYSPAPLSRNYCPPEGGESFDMVAKRAEGIIRMILNSHSVKLSDPPEFLHDKKKTTMPDTLPDGIPHVVIVSHNIFLTELYEKLYSWGGEREETDCLWNNTSWSRHILWYDEGTDKLDFFDMKYCKDYPW